MKNTPDYQRIYTDLIDKNYPHLKEKLAKQLNKKKWSVLEVITISNQLAGKSDKETSRFNQKHRSYSPADIRKMLDYQKKHRLNNSQLAAHFRLSRNTVTKWKKNNVIYKCD